MKVLHVIPSFAPAWYHGGAIQSVYQLCLRLPQHGCDVRVLTTDSNGPDEVLDVQKNQDIQLAEGLRVNYCHRTYSMAFSPHLLRLLPSYIRWADIVHLTAVYSFPTIPTLLMCKAMNKPLVWSPRGALQRWEGSSRVASKEAWERICRIVAPKRLTFHVTSDDEARESLGRIPGVNVAKIPNGVEIPELQLSRPQPDELRLLFLGRIDPKKGIENLLEACNLLNDRSIQKWRLTIAGTGDPQYMESLGNQVSRLGLTDYVKFVGHIEGAEKQKLFEEASIMVVPSFTENFGLVVTEGLAHAVPVIASTGTPWKQVEEVNCGLWVDNDPGTLAEAIKRMSQMQLNEMGMRGRRWMQEEFAWDKRAREMFDVYSSMIGVSQAAYS